MLNHSKSTFSIPLLGFFIALQRHDRARGKQSMTLDEYGQIWPAIERGIGMTDTEALFALCKLLWFKPYHNETIFRDLFDDYVEQYIKKEVQQSEATNTEIDPTEATNTPKPKKDAPKTEAAETNPEQAEVVDDEPINIPQHEVVKEMYWLSFTEQKQIEHGLDFEVKTPPELPSSSFFLSTRHAPFAQRNIAQLVNNVRLMKNTGPRDIPDWPHTIQRLAKQGYLDSIEKTRRPQTSLLLHFLIDTGGSMTPFHSWSNDFSAQLPEDRTRYFHNCPIEYLYEDQLLHHVAIRTETLAKLSSRRIVVISDAGAARSTYAPDRIAATRTWLAQNRRHKIVWLNPLPRARWATTSAADIATLVPMFDMSDAEMLKAFRILSR